MTLNSVASKMDTEIAGEVSRKMSRVTVQDIADELSLSIYAVSRALSGKSGVSEQTRKMVLDKAESLGYVARKRAKPKPASIEIIYHDQGVAHRELWVEIQAGAQNEANRLGVETAVRWTTDPRIANQVNSPNTGFLLVGPHDEAMADAILATKQPCVTVGDVGRKLASLDCVYSTDREASVRVAEHLLDLGHRKIIYSHGKFGYPGRIDRQSAFADALTGKAELREMTFQDDNAPGSFRHDLLALAKESFEPTAFYCGNDGVAVTVASQLMQMGLRIPQDISVVGYADYAIATQIAPALTTVRMPFRAMGAASVRLLLARLSRKEPLGDLPPLRFGLTSELVIRESSGPAPAHSWLARLQTSRI